MCVVSFVGDHYQDRFVPSPWFPYQPGTTSPNTTPNQIKPLKLKPDITKEEFDALKKEVEDMKALLIKAKEYDERNNEPNCEMEDKIKLLREIGKIVGVDLDEIFKPKQ